MASEIRVDKINSLSGVGTVTLSPTGVDISGITTVQTLKVGTGLTASEDGDIFFTGVCTATTFAGSGANLTALPAGNLTGALPAISGANLTGIAATDNVRTGILDVAGVSTFRNTMNVGAAVTISESGIEASGIGITVANINGAQIGGRRNIIINGAMQVAQRGTSFTNISNTGVIGSVDRMVMVGANLDELAFAGKQTSDGPDGFANCFEFDVTTAENALDANDLAYIRYKVEGQDLVPLFNADGTGKDFTLSFYVKAYQAGTYQLNIYKNQGPRFISKTYTVDASATWQRVVIPFTGDTGTTGMNDDNGNGFQIAWILVAGTDYTSAGVLPNWGGWPGNTGFAGGQAVNVASSANNYFRITGIQLELGSQATAFEHRSYGEELSLCQRYYYVHVDGDGQDIGVGAMYNSTLCAFSVKFPVSMRSAPSLDYVSSTDAYRIYRTGASDQFTSMGIVRAQVNSAAIDTTTGTSGTEGVGAVLSTATSSGYIAFSSEL